MKISTSNLDTLVGICSICSVFQILIYEVMIFLPWFSGTPTCKRWNCLRLILLMLISSSQHLLKPLGSFSLWRLAPTEIYCKLRLSSRHDSGPKSGIVFDKSHRKALLSQRRTVGVMDLSF